MLPERRAAWLELSGFATCGDTKSPRLILRLEGAGAPAGIGVANAIVVVAGPFRGGRKAGLGLLAEP